VDAVGPRVLALAPGAQKIALAMNLDEFTLRLKRIELLFEPSSDDLRV
jgi:hypothetical protein